LPRATPYFEGVVMSSSMENVVCPKCGREALQEQDTDTCEIHVWCTVCSYDSDNEKKKEKELWKTTIVIWSDFDPQDYTAEELGRESMHGDAHCSSMKTKYVKDVKSDSDWDETEFFG
jgi:hypothetical protein